MEKLNIKQYKCIELTKLVVNGQLAISIDAAFKDCVILAMTEWKIVELTFAGEVYIIDPMKLIYSIEGTEHLRETLK